MSLYEELKQICEQARNFDSSCDTLWNLQNLEDEYIMIPLTILEEWKWQASMQERYIETLDQKRKAGENLENKIKKIMGEK